jgi:FkbH-like protein
MMSLLDLPIDAAHVLRKKNAIRQELLGQPHLLEKRIAVLGGSTTAEVVDQLEIFLLARGIRPVFYQGEYHQYYEEALFPSEALKLFRPELVYLHTTVMNVRQFPAMTDDAAAVENLLSAQLAHFRSVWDGIAKNLQCPVVQNNFEQPWYRPLGNLDGSDDRGRARFVSRLNEGIAQEAGKRNDVHLFDLHYLSARLGLDRWFNPRLWYLYKYAMDLEMIPHLAHALSAHIAALWGKTHKGLVLDLDNTLWGGVIGDDGVEGIQLGAENAEAEAYADFQRYVRALRERGVVLAVCSKNEMAAAQAGFAHPNSVLKLTDFSAFRANWETKSQNVEAIAADINIGLDSLVFVDDNPAERELVQAQLPSIAVPDVGEDVTEFIRLLDRAVLFETASISTEDLRRSEFYSGNRQRVEQQAQFASYEDFLKSLEMTAEIRPFDKPNLERIVQLINKTNQFNLTTKRCTPSEVEHMASDGNHIALYGRLQDKFGDNGLVTVVAGEIRGDELHIHLWLMSCRVLKRGMEQAMFQQLCLLAQERKISNIIGYYLPTAKNNMVAGLYAELGFTKVTETEKETLWRFDLSHFTPESEQPIRVIDHGIL